MAKVIAGILKPLVCKSQQCIHNTQHILEQIRDITLGPAEFIISYDVIAIFTLVLVTPALNIIQNKLDQDQELHLRTKLPILHIIELLGFCLHNTYFLF